MRAIIIEDKDARALLDQLKLKSMQEANHLRGYAPGEAPQAETVGDIHRAFHYVVCRWLQEQGCDVVR